jgi:hypothetical protein
MFASEEAARMSLHSLRRLFATAFSGCVLAFAFLVCLAPAASGSFGPTVEPLGPVEKVWPLDSQSACDSGHLADLPARAFRDQMNRVDMPTPNGEPPRVRNTTPVTITWQGSHRMLGPDLNHLLPEQQTTYSDSRLCTAPKSNVTFTNPYAPNFPCRNAPWDVPPAPCPQGVPPAAQWPPPQGYEPWMPGNFHDWEWIDSTWAYGDGSTVVAYLHDNYKGYEDLNGDGFTYDDCALPSNLLPPPAKNTPEYDEWAKQVGTYVTNNCWYASVTMARSTDGGATFGCDTATADQQYCGGPTGSFLAYVPPFYTRPPQHLAISSPYTYVPNTCCRQGVPEPSNIIKRGSYYYMMFRLNLPHNLQDVTPWQRQCIARTPNIEDPAGWRGWSAETQDYTVTFVNPYTHQFDGSDTRESHLCSPLNTSIQPRTLVYSSYFNQYMLIGELPDSGGPSVYYSLSSDMVNWGPPQLLIESAVYGSIIDDNDPAASSNPSINPTNERNFYQADQKAYLYIGGRVRYPIKFRALRWATGLGDGCPGGFDGHVGTVATAAGRNYTGDDHAYLASSLGAQQSFSYFDKEDYPTSCGNPSPDPVQVRDGSDVWYSGAFVFPSTDFNSQGQPTNDVTFFRLENSNSAAGALSLRSDGRVHFVTDPNLSQAGDETELVQSGGQNGVPIANNGCWHFYEIHQKIGDTSTTNELWIDNQKQSTVQAAVDNYHGNPYDRYRAGIVTAGGNAPFSMWTDMVGIGYGGPLSFNMCRGVNDTLP